MPGHDRIGLDDDQGRTPVAPEAGQLHYRWSAEVNFGRFLAERLQQSDWLAQSKVL